MGYRPPRTWLGELVMLNNDDDEKDTVRVICGLSLTLRHAIGEIEWKIKKDPIIEESGSFARVLQDLEFALEGADKLRAAAIAAFRPIAKPRDRRRR